MAELLTAAQMRALEQAEIDSGRVSGRELMERAGRGVVDAIFAEWPELAKVPHRASVLCGPGNNGGDGFVIARLLRDWGWEVEVFLFGTPEKLPADARENYLRWSEIGSVTVRQINPPPLVDEFISIPKPIDILVDALFGIGLSRPFAGVFTQFAQAAPQKLLKERGVRTIAIDMPSGLCADSGRVLGVAIPADLTVTFHRRKPGHVLGDGPALAGKTVVAGLGLEPQQGGANDAVTEIDLPTVAIEKQTDQHKFTHGHALILTGGAGKTGAARLAARGALRIGAGLVTLGVPGAAQMEVASQITALMLTRIDDGDELTRRLEDARISALCLGPGLGHDRARALVPVAAQSGRALVLDADALSAFADDPARLFPHLHARCVLTPHGGEFARLFPDIAEKLSAPATSGPAYSKVDATRDAAQRAGCVVLFKGADTVIADPQGRCSVQCAHAERAAPWLATAGSGDVLAGFITGLLARGVSAKQAAETAAWLHVACALEFGPGLIAEDLPEVLPAVLRRLAG